jgi:hypothetical protein
MPAVNPALPIAPGMVTPSSGYPEYGVGGGTPGSAAGWKIVTANDAQQKMTYASQGYLAWFTSLSAAQNFVSSESSLAGSGNVPNPANLIPGLTDIGDFFHRLTESSTWTRVGEVALGGILIYAGIRALASGSTVSKGVRNAGSTITSPAKKATKAAVKVAVPEARLAGRVAAKRVAPKATARVASHRAQVKKYGAKTPYARPEPRVTATRVSHVYHHTTPKRPTTAKPKAAKPK